MSAEERSSSGPIADEQPVRSVDSSSSGSAGAAVRSAESSVSLNSVSATGSVEVAESSSEHRGHGAEDEGAPAKRGGWRGRREPRGKKERIVDPVFEDATLGWFRAHPASPFLSAGIGFGLIAAFVAKNVRREDRRDGLTVAEALDTALLLGGIMCAILLVVMGFMYIAWRRRYWAITQKYVLEKAGAFSTSRRKAAIESIDAVDVSRNLVAKIFGFSVVTIRLPDSETIEFRYMRVADGEQLRRQLLDAMEEIAQGTAPDSAVGDPARGPGAAEAPEDLSHTDSVGSGVTESNSTDSGEKESSGTESGGTKTSDADSADAEADTDKKERHWVGGKPQRERVDFRALDRDEAIVYDLPVARSVEAQAWRAGFGALVVAIVLGILAVPAVLILARFNLPIRDYAAEIVSALVSINVVLLLIGGAYAAFRAATKYYASKVRVVPGAFGISRGLLKDFSSTLYTTRVHWIDVSQPFAWRWPGYWRLRVRTVSIIDYDDDDDAEDDNAKPNELVLPVATLEEIGHILGLLAPYTNVDPVAAVGVASRHRSLTAVTSRRARLFNPLVYGHEGYLLSDDVLYVRTGRWTTSLVAIPLKNIQHTGLDQGPLQRLRGIQDVSVSGALSAGDCLIENLDDQVADALFAELRERTRTPQH
ncbi:PH domain-containing protein [Populibacterium corticicola]|uniref:PH domain-containing protein n=1 Tax=Populibacterium corticicola TaxID=1812826 RepID=A0ABW5XKT2_9MICO